MALTAVRTELAGIRTAVGSAGVAFIRMAEEIEKLKEGLDPVEIQAVADEARAIGEELVAITPPPPVVEPPVE